MVNPMIRFFMKVRRMDDLVLLFIDAYIKNRFLNFIMPPISYMGNNGAIWIIASVPLLVNVQNRRHGIKLIIALAMASVMGNFIIKPLIGRLRPFESDLELSTIIKIPLDFSFPSGHTAAAFAAAVVMAKIGVGYGGIWFIFAFVMAFSRIYLFVHYPTDVLAGMFLGFVSGKLALFFF
jgi:undecaprenyl-diphosphatase